MHVLAPLKKLERRCFFFLQVSPPKPQLDSGNQISEFVAYPIALGAIATCGPGGATNRQGFVQVTSS